MAGTSSVQGLRTLREQRSSAIYFRAPGALALSTAVLLSFDVLCLVCTDFIAARVLNVPLSLSLWQDTSALWGIRGLYGVIAFPIILNLMPKLAALGSRSWALMSAQCIGSGITLILTLITSLALMFYTQYLGFSQMSWTNVPIPVAYAIAAMYLFLAAGFSRRSLKQMMPMLSNLWKPCKAGLIYAPHFYAILIGLTGIPMTIFPEAWVPLMYGAEHDLASARGKLQVVVVRSIGIGAFVPIIFSHLPMCVSDKVATVYKGTVYLNTGYVAAAVGSILWAQCLSAQGLDPSYHRVMCATYALGAVFCICAMYKVEPSIRDAVDNALEDLGYKELEATGE